MKILDLPSNALQVTRNLVRSLRRRGLDYVVLQLEGSFPERTPQRRAPFPIRMLPIFPSEVSLQEIQHIADLIGGDQRVRGVILRLGTLQAGPPTLHTLRRMIRKLRNEDKRTIAWMASAGTWDYYLASACDEIIFPPSGRLNVLGLRSEALFLKETLEMVGVEADLESIAEYKVTPDMFRRSRMTEPHREMLDAILDSYYAELIGAIAEGRGLQKENVRDLIDAMPLAPADAVKTGLIDAVLYEDELAEYLAGDRGNSRDTDEPRVPLVTWDNAARWLHQPVRWTTRKRIGVVSLEGMIAPGESRRVPTPLPLPVEAQAGAETISRALRQAEADPHIAATILHVDSPGGSSLASDLIWREVCRLRERKPVVVLMGNQAASGGYYVSAPADRIVARPTTMTGSIGIWGGKLVLERLYDRLGVGREDVQRGARAGLYSGFEPFSEQEREHVRQELGEFYTRFKRIVGEGRGLALEEVERVARGRVWTGEQAREIGLVDELGDFQTALAAAKELAGLEPEKHYTVIQITPSAQEMLPRQFPTDDGLHWAALLGILQDLAHVHVWAMAPWQVRVRG